MGALYSPDFGVAVGTCLVMSIMTRGKSLMCRAVLNVHTFFAKESFRKLDIKEMQSSGTIKPESKKDLAFCQWGGRSTTGVPATFGGGVAERLCRHTGCPLPSVAGCRLRQAEGGVGGRPVPTSRSVENQPFLNLGIRLNGTYAESCLNENIRSVINRFRPLKPGPRPTG